jgi:excisionase family DNA binding protein
MRRQGFWEIAMGNRNRKKPKFQQGSVGFKPTLIDGKLIDLPFLVPEGETVTVLPDRCPHGDQIDLAEEVAARTVAKLSEKQLQSTETAPKDELKRLRTKPQCDLTLEESLTVMLDGRSARLPERLRGRLLEGDKQPEAQAEATKYGHLAKRMSKKLEDPAGNPTMTVKEAAHAFDKSIPTIYRWIQEGRLKSSVPGRVLTNSVKRLLDSER